MTGDRPPQPAHPGERARPPYPSDLTDEEWQQIQPLIPPKVPRGQPRLHDRREIVNAICYVQRVGCPWRYLPHDLPPWQTVYAYFRDWRQDGTWAQISAVLERRPHQRPSSEDDNP